MHPSLNANFISYICMLRIFLGPGLVALAFNLNTWEADQKQRQENKEYEASLIYTVEF